MKTLVAQIKLTERLKMNIFHQKINNIDTWFVEENIDGSTSNTAELLESFNEAVERAVDALGLSNFEPDKS